MDTNQPIAERAYPGSRRWTRTLPYLVLPAFATLLLWRALAGGEALLPARLLLLVLPWRDGAPPDAAIPWNPLLWDGIAQFYPWRHFAAQSMAAGQIPLWAPYQLCGTPFLANSQSAPLYPLHWFYYLPGSVALKIGWLAYLHLT